jgi:hypothetical protein
MKIEFLYFKNCPGHESALSLLEYVLLEGGISESIEKIEVTTEELAIRHHFLGSPSIRINGKDIEGREDASEYGLKCRIYQVDGKPQGFPSEQLIRNGILKP